MPMKSVVAKLTDEFKGQGTLKDDPGCGSQNL